MSVRLRTKLGAALATVVVVGAAAGMAIGANGAADAATGASAGTWGPVQDIPGVEALVSNQGGFNAAYVTAVGCSTLGNCVAVGYYYPPITSGDGLPFVVTEVNGTWGNAQPVAGLPTLAAGSVAKLTQVSCGSPDFCTAVGTYTDTALHYFVITESAGAWGTPITLDASGLGSVASLNVNSVSCSSAVECTMIGSYTPSTTAAMPAPFTVDESAGTWGKLQPLAGVGSLPHSSPISTSDLDSLSCGAPGDCTAGGSYSYGTEQQPFIVSESAHSWGAPQLIPGLSALSSGGQDGDPNEVTSVSCPDASDCAVVGTYFPELNSPGLVFTLDEAGGVWGEAKALSVPSGDLINSQPTFFVSCRSAGHCVTAGTTNPGSASSVVVTATESSGGAWAAATPIPGTSAIDEAYAVALVCVPAGDCTVLGVRAPGGNLPFEIFSATSADGGPMGAAQQVASTGNGTPLSPQLACPRSGDCVVTFTNDSTSLPQVTPQMVTESAPAATVTHLAFTPRSITYAGAATSLAVSGSVSSTAGTPNGSVTLRVDGTAVSGCTNVSFSGTVSCKGTTAILTGGEHLVTLAYSGGGDFAASVSPSLPLTVAKRGTTTILKLAKTSVTYGHESAEKFTASVSQAGRVYPAGEVAVRIGGTTICAITLSKGTGSCTLANTRLRPGTYTFVAVYGGDRNYDQSTSAKKTVKVAA